MIAKKNIFFLYLVAQKQNEVNKNGTESFIVGIWSNYLENSKWALVSQIAFSNFVILDNRILYFLNLYTSATAHAWVEEIFTQAIRTKMRNMSFLCFYGIWIFYKNCESSTSQEMVTRCFTAWTGHIFWRLYRPLLGWLQIKSSFKLLVYTIKTTGQTDYV
jgi:hypothetical protein